MKIGIIGAGQLARMMILAGTPMGLQFATYSPDANHPLSNLVSHTQAGYDDLTPLSAFAQQVDVVTYEHENLPVDCLRQFEQRFRLHPSAEVIAQVQDRLLEKQMFQRLGVATNDFCAIDSTADAIQAAEKLGYPFIIKTRRNGYDGKGQYRIHSPEDIDALSDQQCQHCIAEAFVDFDREVSVIAVRTHQGECHYYDICENEHRQGILHQTHNRINDPIAAIAYQAAEKLLTGLNYVGVMALELFVKGGDIFANEVAPRVHNSGHWTIEGAATSQFENHLRAICHLPIGSTHSVASVCMTNCIGDMPNLNDVLSNPNAHYHDYEKAPRAGRKLGHITEYI